MHVGGNISLLDLLDLPDLQWGILLYLVRNGPTEGTALTQATGLDPAQVDRALEAAEKVVQALLDACNRQD